MSIYQQCICRKKNKKKKKKRPLTPPAPSSVLLSKKKKKKKPIPKHDASAHTTILKKYNAVVRINRSITLGSISRQLGERLTHEQCLIVKTRNILKYFACNIIVSIICLEKSGRNGVFSMPALWFNMRVKSALYMLASQWKLCASGNLYFSLPALSICLRPPLSHLLHICR